MRKKFIAEHPKAIRIGPHNYKVELANTVRGHHDQECWGTCNVNEQLIRLCNNMPDTHRAVWTSLHEAMHGIWNAKELPHNREEQIISHICSGLIELWQSNPKYLDWLVRGLKRG